MAELICCLCLFARTGAASPADTIINGQAVCIDHAGYVQGGEFSSALNAAVREEGQRP